MTRTISLLVFVLYSYIWHFNFKNNLINSNIDNYNNNNKKKYQLLSVHWKDWWWSWNSNTLATWCEELTHLKTPWCWERLRTGGEGDDRGRDGWTASPTQWTWIWVNSGRWWWTGRLGVLRFMGSRKVRHDWATELNWTDSKCWLFCQVLFSLVMSLLGTPDYNFRPRF